MSTFTYQEQDFSLLRYPETSNQSLQAWNAADELLLRHYKAFREQSGDAGEPATAIIHDRFGVLATVLHPEKPAVVLSFSSQEKALRQNLLSNKLPVQDEHWLKPLDPLPFAPDITLMKVPKSVDLFRLYLHQLHQAFMRAGAEAEPVIYAGFMTRHFTPQMLEAAGEYFEEVSQTRARKKARLLEMRKPRAEAGLSENPQRLMHEVAAQIPPAKVSGEEVSTDADAITLPLKQYYGVFSAGGVDAATLLLLEHLKVAEDEQTLLDLGCGNGIIGLELWRQKPGSELHLMDDAALAVASARYNIKQIAADALDDQILLHQYDGPDMFPNDFFDLVVSNPPSHLEHENNIEVALALFAESAKKLRSGGRMLVVSSRHHNFRTHLNKSFTNVRAIAQNDSFEVLEAKAV